MSRKRPRIKLGPELGRGATAVVHRARLTEPWGDWAAGTWVARKRLLAEYAQEPELRAALTREAAALGRAQHPSLQRLVFHEQEGPQGPELLSALIEGPGLDQELEAHGPLEEKRVRALGAQLAGALAALHANGLAHGDLKPENVRLDGEGRAVLVDLGFARDLVDASAPESGSVAYLSPERARGAPPSAAADVYALGTSLWQLAADAHPLLEAQHAFTGGPGALFARLAAGPAPILSSRAPLASPFLDAALAHALQPEPELRPSAAELAALFEDGERSSWWLARQASGVAAPTTGALRFVGREVELARLQSAWSAAAGDDEQAAAGGAVWILGREGSGKTRLVEEFAARARLGTRPPRILRQRALQRSASSPWAPLLALLRTLLSLAPDASPRARERALIEELVRPGDAALLCEALEPGADARGALSGPIARLLAALAEQSPLLIFLDDVQRADGGTLATLGRLAAQLAGRPLLLALGLREGEAPDRAQGLERLRRQLALAAPGGEGVAQLNHLHLGPLARAEVDALVRAQFHARAPRLRIAERFWESTRGEPGLLSELLRGALAQGVVRPASAQDARLLLIGSPDALALAPEPAAQLESELAQLPPAERSWLERGALVGERIEVPLLAQAFDAPPTEVADALARLALAGWLVAEGEGYGFARPAQREALEQSLPADLARAVHIRLARALAPAQGQEASLTQSMARAWHLAAAESWEPLLAHARRLHAELPQEAPARWSRLVALAGLEALNELPSSDSRQALQAELLLRGVRAASRLGRREETAELLDELGALAPDPESNPARVAEIYLLHARCAADSGHLGLARGWLTNACALAERSGVRELECEARCALALVHAKLGEVREGRRAARRAAARAKGALPRARAWLVRALFDVLDDFLERALGRVDRALSLARAAAAEDAFLCEGLLLRARIWRSLGHPDRARAAATRALSLARRTDDRRLEAEAGARLGGLYVDLGNEEEAEANLREARLLSVELQDPRAEVLAEIFLGTLLGERGEAECEGVLARAAELASESGFGRLEDLARAIGARVQLARGRPELALEQARRAVAGLEQRGAELADRLVVQGTLALACSAAGELDESAAREDELRQYLRARTRRLGRRARAEGGVAYLERLMRAALHADGPLYPRSRDEDVRSEQGGGGRPGGY